MVIVAIVIVVVAVAGVGAYVVLSGGSPSPSSSTTSSSTTSSSSAASSTTHASTSSSGGSTTSHTTTATQASSTVSTASTASTYSCASTFTTGTLVDYTSQYIGLIKQYSSISFMYSDVSSSGADNGTISYTVTSASGGIYTANITLAGTENGQSSNGSILAQVDSNTNTVVSVAVSEGGQSFTFTGDQAKSYFDLFMTGFGAETAYANNYGRFTDSTYFHSAGTSSKTFGGATFDVTTWTANQLPLTVTECGQTSTLSDFSLQYGTPPGTSLTFITYFHIAQTAPSSEETTFQLLSMTVA